jgi:branched-chain amino acid transport system substrate-binding protein
VPAVALTLAFAAGCRTQATPLKGDPTRLGVGALPGSPGYASTVRGVELAIEQLRSEGATYRIRLPANGLTSAVQVAQQLRDDSTVLAVIGHPESGSTLEAVPIYADAEHDGANGVVLISPTATSPRLTGISPWFFRVAPSDADAARFAANWVHDSLGARRAAIIYRNDPYGRDWSETFAKAFARHGTIIAREPYLTDIVEWDAYAALLSIPFVGGDGTEGMRNDPDAAGAHVVTFFSAQQADGPEGARFLARYRERYRSEPDYFAAQAYDATLVIGRTAAHGATSRAALRLALERVGSGAPAIDGVSGRIGFAPSHDVRQRRLFVTRIAPTPAAAPTAAPSAVVK